MKNNSVIALAEINRKFMGGAVVRKNSAGSVLGKVLSYISLAPAGDVRKELAKTGLKGKALKNAVNEVLRGERDMAWAIHDAQASVARSMGFSPIKTQTNKDGSVLTTRYELVPQSHDEQKQAILDSMSDADLMALLESRKKADAEAKAKAEAKAEQITNGEQPLPKSEESKEQKENAIPV
jgi:hypothetical protein